MSKQPYCGTAKINKNDQNRRYGTAKECIPKIGLFGFNEITRKEYNQLRVNEKVNEMKQKINELNRKKKELRRQQT